METLKIMPQLCIQMETTAMDNTSLHQYLARHPYWWKQPRSRRICLQIYQSDSSTVESGISSSGRCDETKGHYNMDKKLPSYNMDNILTSTKSAPVEGKRLWSTRSLTGSYWESWLCKNPSQVKLEDITQRIPQLCICINPSASPRLCQESKKPFQITQADGGNRALKFWQPQLIPIYSEPAERTCQQGTQKASYTLLLKSHIKQTAPLCRAAE